MFRTARLSARVVIVRNGVGPRFPFVHLFASRNVLHKLYILSNGQNAIHSFARLGASRLGLDVSLQLLVAVVYFGFLGSISIVHARSSSSESFELNSKEEFVIEIFIQETSVAVAYAMHFFLE